MIYPITNANIIGWFDFELSGLIGNVIEVTPATPPPLITCVSVGFSMSLLYPFPLFLLPPPFYTFLPFCRFYYHVFFFPFFPWKHLFPLNLD